MPKELVPCRDCGAPVSPTAEKCPACGSSNPTTRALWGNVGAAGCALAILAVVVFIIWIAVTA